MRKTIFFLTLLFLSFTAQAQIVKVKSEVDLTKSTIQSMGRDLEGMKLGSNASKKQYASDMRHKANTVIDILDRAVDKIPNWTNPKFAQRGYTYSKTKKYIDDMKSNMYQLRANLKEYIKSTGANESRKYALNTLDKYNKYINLFNALTKYAREAQKIELVVEVDERTERNRKANEDQSNWLREINSNDPDESNNVNKTKQVSTTKKYEGVNEFDTEIVIKATKGRKKNKDRNKPDKKIVTKATKKSKTKLTGVEIYKRLNVIRKNENAANSVRINRSSVTLYQDNKWWSVDLLDIDFSKSNVAYDSQSQKYRLYINTKNNEKTIIPSWGDDNSSLMYRMSETYASKSDAEEFKSLLQQLLPKGSTTSKDAKKPLSRKEIISQLKNLVSAKSFEPNCSLVVTGDRIKIAYENNQGWYLFDVNDLDFNAGGTEKRAQNEYRARLYTKNQEKSVVTDTGGVIGQASWRFKTKTAAETYRSLLRQLSEL